MYADIILRTYSTINTATASIYISRGTCLSRRKG